MTKLSSVRVLQITGKLAANHIIDKKKVDGYFAFQKIEFFSHHKVAVLRYARDAKKREKVPTKVNPKGINGMAVVTVQYPKKLFDVAQITIDDIDNFSKVANIPHGQKHKPVVEKWFKHGMQKIIGETGKFTDWGGEKNDLFTTKVRIKGKRLPCAVCVQRPWDKGCIDAQETGQKW